SLAARRRLERPVADTWIVALFRSARGTGPDAGERGVPGGGGVQRRLLQARAAPRRTGVRALSARIPRLGFAGVPGRPPRWGARRRRTALATAPTIYPPRARRSIEAVWKYLLICSVGIALALLGTFMLALAQSGGAAAPSLLRSALLKGPVLHPVWFKAAFVFLFVGYGTKAGLVPMHTSLPDAHGEAASPVSALLSGALLNCAFLAVLRIVQVGHAARQDALLAPVLVGFGLASMLVAGALLLRQSDYKRMLAY